MAKSIKIMAWNANGLLNHLQELQVILNKERIDVCLISESHFTKETFIQISGYKTYNALHPNNNARGGSSIIIKENIYHYEVQKCEEQHIQAVTVCIKTKRYPVNITAIYCPPKYALKADQYRNMLQELGNRFILGGDFNAKNTFWGSRLTTTKGKELLYAINDLKCNVLSTGKPTYWPTDPQKTPDLIDFFIYKNISSSFLSIREGYDMNSDHSPIILNLSEDLIQKEKILTLTNKNTDWMSFKLDLDSITNLQVPLKTPEEIDKEVANFISNIQKCSWQNTPKIITKLRDNYYPEHITELIVKKRKQRQKWQNGI